MKIEFVNAFNNEKNEFCTKFPHGYVRCENFHLCSICEVADRVRKSNFQATSKLPTFDWRDALPQTPARGGENWYGKPVILSLEALDRLKIERHLINQIMVAYDGPGCFKRNEAGEIDGFLLCDKQKKITVNRKECFGIPTQQAARKYDEYFYLGLCKLLGIGNNERKDGGVI